jgi:HAE1 family hydrophobic/amphiphilic exporter-1
VVILGTCAALGAFGFSINMLTMFAMVLAIGLLVDDTIVVVENVERLMSEEGLSPREATAKSMGQVTSALIGFFLVLTALFGPMAFFGGSTGIIYRQFSVTIVTSMLLSVAVALILTPVLCASILKPVARGQEAAEGGIRILSPFFLWFNRGFLRFRDAFVGLVGYSLSRKLRFVAIYILIVGSLGLLFLRMPTSYLPNEDQGILLSQIIMPTGATLEQTRAVANEVERYFLEKEKEAVTMVAFSTMRNALVFTFPPPSIPELGTSIGFDFQLVDRGGGGHTALTQARNQLLGMAAQDPRLAKVRPNSMEDVPEYRIDVDWEKAGALGLPIASIHNTISAAFGGAYVNDFIQGARVKRVFVQADAPHRMLPTDLEKLYVRNSIGKMVPYTSFASGRWTSGSPRLERFNAFPSMAIWGEPAPGKSSGEAMDAMEELVAKLPQGFGYDWTGLSYQEQQAAAQTGLLYTFSILVVFLFLAALYGKWNVPLAVLMILPLGVIGGFAASTLRGLPSDVYFQIGMLNTLGLATKNAILIVQFAMAGVAQGAGLVEAALQAVRLRLRPILMTSMTTGLSVLPLAYSTGAGAGAMNAIGTAVLGGMITGTVLVVLFAPLFYVLIEQAFGKRKKAMTMA